MSAANTHRIRGLESIYLQRLEPAYKPKRRHRGERDKAKFRVMHHRFHDEPEWYVDPTLDEEVVSEHDSKINFEAEFSEKNEYS